MSYNKIFTESIEHTQVSQTVINFSTGTFFFTILLLSGRYIVFFKNTAANTNRKIQLDTLSVTVEFKIPNMA
jgi:hypothetical protein